MDGFQLKNRNVVKQITFTSMNGGGHTYYLETPTQRFTYEEMITIAYSTKYLHGIQLMRPGRDANDLEPIIKDFCKDAVIVVQTLLDKRTISQYIDSSQIVTLHDSSFYIPKSIENFCGNTENNHFPRYCTICKGEYILTNASYKNIL